MTKRNPLVSAFKDMIYFGMETFGRYYSSYRAFVADNIDPLSLQRVKLIIPQVGGNNIYEYWAMPKGVFYGAGYGMQMMPQVGELVWAEFESGHPDVPIYSLGHPGNAEMPTGDNDLKDPNCYWFKSPKGATVKINDTKKYISISFNGAEIKINQAGLISVKNDKTDLKTLLQDILETYMKTTTVQGIPLSPASIENAVDNITELYKLFI